MSGWLVFSFCFLAIVIGWLLGKFPFKLFWHRLRHRGWHQSYLRVLHLLLNEQSDQAIESFVQNWPVTPTNMELHNALANMLRKKGETDRAIRIHKSIVECSKLSPRQIEQASIELANDYMAAGLLDRAERLLINLVNSHQTVDERILEILQRVYQTEKEWYKAITIAEQLLAKRSLKLPGDKLIAGKQAMEIAQYYCEIAQKALLDDRFSDVKKSLEKALAVDANCVRASMMQLSMAVERHKREKALSALSQIEQQDCRMLPECIDSIQACFVDDEKGLSEYLMRLQQSYPSAALEKAIFESLKRQNNPDAEQQLLSFVQARPTLQGIQYLLKQHNDNPSEPLNLLQDWVAQVMKGKALYQCVECGFSGAQLHWLCPKCLHWNTIRRRRGVEGD